MRPGSAVTSVPCEYLNILTTLQTILTLSPSVCAELTVPTRAASPRGVRSVVRRGWSADTRRGSSVTRWAGLRSAGPGVSTGVRSAATSVEETVPTVTGPGSTSRVVRCVVATSSVVTPVGRPVVCPVSVPSTARLAVLTPSVAWPVRSPVFPARSPASDGVPTSSVPGPAVNPVTPSSVLSPVLSSWSVATPVSGSVASRVLPSANSVTEKSLTNSQRICSSPAIQTTGSSSCLTVATSSRWRAWTSGSRSRRRRRPSSCWSVPGVGQL